VLAYLTRRILGMIPALLLASILIFSFMHLAPGDPASLMLGDSATQTQVEQLREAMGLNKPLPVQYIDWITRVFKGDLGASIFFQKPVLEVIASHAETSVFLAVFSMILVIILGVSIGIISAVKYNSILDQSFMGLAMFGASIPTFWSGLVFMLVFSVYLGLLPSSGFPSVIESGNVSNLRYLILPCIVLAIPNSALIIRLTRSSMLDIINEDYVRTAKAKGLSVFEVNMKHVFRNALISVVSALGFTFLGLASGTVVTETVFALPGIGRLIVQSVLRRDYPVIQGAILIIVFLYMLINLIVDISYAYLDPRIRYD
jgi:peptide/nickel transport system permease protein